MAVTTTTATLRLQDKFSWGAVAMAGIGAAVGGALGKIPGLDKLTGSAFVNDVVKGALGSAITQGIGVATGLQDRFSWAGVAAAGIGNGVGQGLAREMGTGNGFLGIKADVGSFASDALSTTASTLANAATRSAIEGSNFGDNVIAALPDAIGGVLGRALGGAGVKKAGASKAQAQHNPTNQGPRSLGGAVAQELVGADADLGGHDIVVTAGLPPETSNPAGFINVLFGDESSYSDSKSAKLPSTQTLNDVAQVVDGKASADALLKLAKRLPRLVARRAAIVAALYPDETGSQVGIPVFDSDGNPMNVTISGRSDEFKRTLTSGDKEIGGAAHEGSNVYLITKDGQAGYIAGTDVNAIAVATTSDGLQIGFGVTIRNGDEARIYSDGIASRWSSEQIQYAVDDYRINLAAERAGRLAENGLRGRAYERQAIQGLLDHMGVGKNTTPATETLPNGKTVTTIFDVDNRTVGLVEFKDQRYLTRSTQLDAQLEIARRRGVPYNLVVGPNTQKISKPLLNQMRIVERQVGGGVFRYDPASDKLTPWPGPR